MNVFQVNLLLTETQSKINEILIRYRQVVKIIYSNNLKIKVPNSNEC